VPLLAGDSDMADVAALADTDIICSTPEKFGAHSSFYKRAWDNLHRSA